MDGKQQQQQQQAAYDIYEQAIVLTNAAYKLRNDMQHNAPPLAYTEETAMDALAIWEHALEAPDVYAWLAGDEGAAQGRVHALEITKLMTVAYMAAETHGYDEPFDWEFVPAVMAQFILFPRGEITDSMAKTIGMIVAYAHKAENENV